MLSDNRDETQSSVIWSNWIIRWRGTHTQTYSVSIHLMTAFPFNIHSQSAIDGLIGRASQNISFRNTLVAIAILLKFPAINLWLSLVRWMVNFIDWEHFIFSIWHFYAYGLWSIRSKVIIFFCFSRLIHSSGRSSPMSMALMLPVLIMAIAIFN